MLHLSGKPTEPNRLRWKTGRESGDASSGVGYGIFFPNSLTIRVILQNSQIKLPIDLSIFGGKTNHSRCSETWIGFSVELMQIISYRYRPGWNIMIDTVS